MQLTFVQLKNTLHIQVLYNMNIHTEHEDHILPVFMSSLGLEQTKIMSKSIVHLMQNYFIFTVFPFFNFYIFPEIHTKCYFVCICMRPYQFICVWLCDKCVLDGVGNCLWEILYVYECTVCVCLFFLFIDSSFAVCPPYVIYSYLIYSYLHSVVDLEAFNV